MKLLVLGGGRFVGRHLVEAAVSAGHEVTTFSRGQTPTPWFAGQQLFGDRRAGNLAALQDQTWDAVIDVNAYILREVRDSVQMLNGKVGRYLFVSTISVLADPQQNSEEGPVLGLDDPHTEEVTGQTYGGLKALCEQEVIQAFGEQATVLRPHLVVGPHDPTGRFSYWPWRAAQGGSMLFPAPPDTPMQWIDARDLAQFGLKLLEQNTPGVFHGAAPSETALSLAKALQQHAPITPVWVDQNFLQEQQVQPWADLPAWLPANHPGSALAQVSPAKSQAAGLQTRPLGQTVADTLAWLKSLPEVKTAGLTLEQEQSLLQLWHQRS